nr:ribonuclease E/G [Actinomycetales bacterium]
MADQQTTRTSTDVETTGEKPERSSTSSGRRRTRVVTPLFSETDEGGPEAPAEPEAPRLAAASLLFQAPDLSAAPARRVRPPREQPAARAEDSAQDATSEDPEDSTEPSDSQDQPLDSGSSSSRRRRGSRGRRRSGDEDSQGQEGPADSGEVPAEAPPEAPSEEPGEDPQDTEDEAETSGSSRRRRRRTRTRSSGTGESSPRNASTQVTRVEGSTRLEAKRQRRKEGREAGRRRQVITESEFLTRREAVDRKMLVREKDGLNQIAVIEDGVLVEHYVARRTQTSMVGNVYLGRVQNVLPSMEAAFVDLGKGRNAVLYAGEVNWDAVGHGGKPRRIEDALKSGDQVLVQVTKDPIGHKGARLTSQITLAGRHLVLVPSGGMTGISRKLPENERNRLKKLLKEMVPEGSGVIVRTAAEGASEEQLRDDVARLVRIWEDIQKKSSSTRNVPVLLKGEPELAVRVVRDVFNEDFAKLVVSGREAHSTISEYVGELAPDLADRVEHWVDGRDLFAAHRVDEQLAKGMDRKV